MTTAQELRDLWINFYKERGHIDIGAVSLIGNGETGVMFNVAGMQPLMPYLLGKSHPSGSRRLCNVQGCVRTVDIDSVGDSSHCTFFEMLGSWSLGDYFKEERTKWSFELLTNVFGFDSDKIAVTCFAGDEFAPRDEETAYFREKSGIKKENIYFLPKKDNWWELERGPCGPDSEMFYITDKKPCGDCCSPACNCGRFVEIGNDVFMQYEKINENKYIPLKQKNVDTGWGLERLLVFLNKTDDVYKTDLFMGAMNIVENALGIKYDSDEYVTRSMRIIVDHIRTAVMLIGDINGILPSNVGPGYVLRRLLRRAMVHARKINLNTTVFCEIATHYILNVYNKAYPMLIEKKDYIIKSILDEVEKFNKTIISGEKEFEKLLISIKRKNEYMSKNNSDYVFDNNISGKAAFKLYETYGFPLDLTKELAKENGLNVNETEFLEEYKKHQELARTASAGVFKGGLADNSQETTKLHTACHLLNAALRKVLGDHVYQRGSNITAERLRFDFSHPVPMSSEEIAKVEKLVNEEIAKNENVTCEEMTVTEAKNAGAIGVFDNKYGEKVKVYSIGSFSKEICGGPHVDNTGKLGQFKILKEQSSSAGIRRIKAILK